MRSLLRAATATQGVGCRVSGGSKTCQLSYMQHMANAMSREHSGNGCCLGNAGGILCAGAAAHRAMRHSRYCFARAWHAATSRAFVFRQAR